MYNILITIKVISSVGRGYNFKVLRAKILYRNSAVKQAKYSYYKPKLNFNIDWVVEKDSPDIAFEHDGFIYVIESRSISAGVDIDELSAILQKEQNNGNSKML